jgi:ABC-type Mn2+/Zn2+ transport system ATPase subunit
MIMKLLKLLCRKTILVIHHDLAKVKDFFTDLILLNQYIIDYGQLEDVFTEEKLEKTYRAELNILHKLK